MEVWEINRELKRGAQVFVKLSGRDEELHVLAARSNGGALNVRVRVDGVEVWRNAGPSSIRVEEQAGALR